MEAESGTGRETLLLNRTICMSLSSFVGRLYFVLAPTLIFGFYRLLTYLIVYFTTILISLAALHTIQ